MDDSFLAQFIGGMDRRLFFYGLKAEARKRTQAVINRRILKTGGITRWDHLTLCSINNPDRDALAFAAEEWPKYYGADTHQGFEKSWEELVMRRQPDPDHFDLAIWQKVDGEEVLVALALGNPSNGHTHLTIKWIERFFGKNHLSGRALWPILTCAEEYAKLLLCERVLIKDPVDSNKYARYGYTSYTHPHVAHGGDYMAKELNHD